MAQEEPISQVNVLAIRDQRVPFTRKDRLKQLQKEAIQLISRKRSRGIRAHRLRDEVVLHAVMQTKDPSYMREHFHAFAVHSDDMSPLSGKNALHAHGNDRVCTASTVTQHRTKNIKRQGQLQVYTRN